MFARNRAVATTQAVLSREQKTLLVEAYTTNVDPLMKLLHIPNLRRLIYSHHLDVGYGSEGTEALISAVFFAAVTSMTEEECQRGLKDTRMGALASFRSSVEDALARANFLGHAEFTILQALVIFLVCTLLCLCI